MATYIYSKMKPKNEGDFALLDSCDVELEDGTRLDSKIALSEKELPSDNIALANKMYFLGEITELTVGFKDGSNIGDMVLISFSSGSTAPSVEISTDNYAGIDNLTLRANCYYELIGLWNGTIWMFVKHEVDL